MRSALLNGNSTGRVSRDGLMRDLHNACKYSILIKISSEDGGLYHEKCTHNIVRVHV